MSFEKIALNAAKKRFLVNLFDVNPEEALRVSRGRKNMNMLNPDGSELRNLGKKMNSAKYNSYRNELQPHIDNRINGQGVTATAYNDTNSAKEFNKIISPTLNKKYNQGEISKLQASDLKYNGYYQFAPGSNSWAFRNAGELPHNFMPGIDYAPPMSMKTQYGVHSKEDIIRMRAATGRPMPEDKIKKMHDKFYVTAHGDRAAAHAFIPFSSARTVAADRAALSDVVNTSYVAQMMQAKIRNSATAEQLQLLDLIRGKNVLSSAELTNAYRQLLNSYKGDAKHAWVNANRLNDSLDAAIKKRNAYYDKAFNVTAVHPDVDDFSNIAMHEDSHMRLANANFKTHLKLSIPAMRKLLHIAQKNNLSIPFSDRRLMQEFLAEYNRVKSLGGDTITIGRNSFLRRQIQDAPAKQADDLAAVRKRQAMAALIRAARARTRGIDALGIDDTAISEGLKQLAVNYNYPVIKTRARATVPTFQARATVPTVPTFQPSIKPLSAPTLPKDYLNLGRA
jgi:hypothetical protein